MKIISVDTVDNGHLPNRPTAINTTIDPALSSISFNSTIALRTLKKLNVRSAGGPDHVPPIFLKNCSNSLSYPIAFFISVVF